MLNKPVPTASAKDSVSIEYRALAPHPALDSMFVLICEWFPVQPDCVSSLSGCDEFTVGGVTHLGGNVFPAGSPGQGRLEETRQTVFTQM